MTWLSCCPLETLLMACLPRYCPISAYPYSCLHAQHAVTEGNVHLQEETDEDYSHILQVLEPLVWQQQTCLLLKLVAALTSCRGVV